MRPLRLLIEYQEQDHVKELRARLDASEAARMAIQEKYNRLELMYGNEVHINNELVDLCKASGIRFRKGLRTDWLSWDKHLKRGVLHFP